MRKKTTRELVENTRGCKKSPLGERQEGKNLAGFRYHIFLRNNDHCSFVVLILRNLVILALSDLFGSIREGAGAARRLKESAIQ